MIAAEHGHLAIFEVYATKFPRVVELSNKKGWTALTTAARFGAIGMVEVSRCPHFSYGFHLGDLCNYHFET